MSKKNKQLNPKKKLIESLGTCDSFSLWSQGQLNMHTYLLIELMEKK